jgi:hypothetical protein
MRRELIVAAAALGSLGSLEAAAATKILLRDTISPLGTFAIQATDGGCAANAQSRTFRLASTTQGSSTVSRTFDPSAGTPPCLWQTQTAAGGQFMYWVTPPLSAAVTISGNISFVIGCKESNAGLNVGARMVVYRYDGKTGGIRETIITSADTAECGTTLAARAIAAAPPTSTALAVGDRLVFTVEMRAIGGTWGGSTTRTGTLGYGGTSGGSGDTSATFTEALSFAADAPPKPAQVR